MPPTTAPICCSGEKLYRVVCRFNIFHFITICIHSRRQQNEKVDSASVRERRDRGKAEIFKVKRICEEKRQRLLWDVRKNLSNVCIRIAANHYAIAIRRMPLRSHF